MLYPIKFNPVYKSKIWGGTKLNEVYNREIPGTDIGEAWEITCRDDGMSTIANGSLQGMSFSRLLNTYKTAITGTIRSAVLRFPLLLKLLDVNSDLSVQVHPTASFIKENNLIGEEEKNEMWYVLYAEDNARMVSGLKKGTTKEILAKAIEDDRIEECLQFSPVKTGDTIMIRAGSVHAACSGMLLYELQQSSDTTYRLYDYHRKDSDGNERRLDVDKALDAIDYNGGVQFLPKTTFMKKQTYSYRKLASCPQFTLHEIEINGSYLCKSHKDFCMLTNIKGHATVASDSMKVELEPGETVFMPACLKIFMVSGECTLLFASIKPPSNLQT